MSDTTYSTKTCSQAILACRVVGTLPHTRHTSRLAARGAYLRADWRYNEETPEQYGARVARAVNQWRSDQRDLHYVPSSNYNKWADLRGVEPRHILRVAEKLALRKGMSKAGALALAARVARVGLLVSVEVEFACREGSTLANQSCSQYTGYPQAAEFTYDGSVKPSAGLVRGMYQEVGITFDMGATKPLTETCLKLVEAGAAVNSTCGLHVHLDARHLTVAQEANRRRHLVAALPWLLELVPASRRRNKYCWPNHVPHPPEPARRYRAINPTSYAKHQTTEVRLGAGSIDPDKILNWVTLLRWLANSVKYYRTFDAFLRSDCPQEVKVWAVLRRAKFAGVTAGQTEGSEA